MKILELIYNTITIFFIVEKALCIHSSRSSIFPCYLEYLLACLFILDIFIIVIKLFNLFTFQMSLFLIPPSLPFASEKVLPTHTSPSPLPASPFSGASGFYRTRHIFSHWGQTRRSSTTYICAREHGLAHVCSLVGSLFSGSSEGTGLVDSVVLPGIVILFISSIFSLTLP